MNVKTHYLISSGKTEYRGLCDIEESIWDYASTEFSNEFQVGTPEYPVLNKILELKNIPVKLEEIFYWSVYPKNISLQKKYLGMYLEDGEWIDLENGGDD
tara:strand:+ start:298 stop:597 length:300 start_codon:yes stop_codon:yes gene_type:complete